MDEETRWIMTSAHRESALAGLSVVREFLGGEGEYGPADVVRQITDLGDKFDQESLLAGLCTVASMLTLRIESTTGEDWPQILRSLEATVRGIEVVEQMPPRGDHMSGPPEE